MKKIGQNIVIFLILLGITYCYPIFFSSSQSPKEETSSVSYVPKEPKTIATQGMARYIHQPVRKFEQHYGKVTKIATLNKETWYQQVQEQSVIQLSVRDGRVTSILLVGNHGNEEPLPLGITLNELSSRIELQTDFLLQDDKEKYYIEIPEDKLLLSPCLAFKNQSYALLQFDTQGILHGVYYCDAKKLLQNMPYKVTNTRPTITQGISNEKLTIGIWQQLTNSPLKMSHTLNRLAKDDLEQFLMDHQKETKWVNALHYPVEQPLYYPTKDFQSDFEKEGILLATRKDYQLELLQRFYDLNYQSVLQANQNTVVGLAHRGSITLLLKEDENSDI